MKEIIKFLLAKIITHNLFYSFVNNFTPVVENDGIKFYCPGSIAYVRAKSMLTKEPDLIGFIDDNVNANDVYYDIGANVGVFTLYAAIKRNAKVFSFEPESSNYFLLNKNIKINSQDDSILAFNIAINNVDKVSILHLKEGIVWGKSGNSFDDNFNEEHEKFDAKFKQGALGISLDTFVYTYKNPCPNHIKIDVDGNEYKIIDGMTKVLSDINLKTLAIEVNTKINITKMVNTIISHDFVIVDGYNNPDYEERGIVNMFFSRVLKTWLMI